jgi:hypothetical protein
MNVTVYTDVDVWEVIAELSTDQRKRVFEDLAGEFSHTSETALNSHPAEAEFAGACEYLMDRYSHLTSNVSDTVVSIARAAGYLG